MKINSASQQAVSTRGGQASIGLFGIPGFNAPRQALPRTPRPSRIKGALNSFSSDGLSAAHYRRPAAPVANGYTAASEFSPSGVKITQSSPRAGAQTLHVSPSTVRRCPSLDDEPALAHSQWLADLAESYGCPYDEEAAAYARSFAGVGMAEHLMAMEG